MMPWLKLFISIASTVLLAWLLLRNINVGILVKVLSNVVLPYLLSALALLAIGYAMRILRWWCMLRTIEPELPVGACIWPYLTSIAVNNLLPFRMGDALRTFGFRQQLRSPAMRILGTLLVERLLDLLTLLGFFFVGLANLPVGVFPEIFTKVAVGLAGAGVLTLASFILLSPFLGRIIRWFAHRPWLVARGWSIFVDRLGHHLVEALLILRSPRLSLMLFGLSLLTWGFEGAVFATVASALEGNISATLGPWFSLAIGTLATLLPSSPGYIGTFDYFATQGLQAYGAIPELATAFALTVHAVLWLPLTIIGLIYLAFRGRHFWTWRRSPGYTSIND